MSAVPSATPDVLLDATPNRIQYFDVSPSVSRSSGDEGVIGGVHARSTAWVSDHAAT